MSIISEPIIDADITSTPSAVDTLPKKVLFIAQKTSSGSASSGALIKNIQNDGSENAYFGAKSQLAAMIRAYKRYNQVTQIDAIGLSDAGGATAASSTVTFTGTATATGTIYINVGSRKNHSYPVAIETGDTAAQVAAALKALIDADTYACVNTGSITLGALPLTAVNAGTVGNSIGIEAQGSVAGISVALAAFSGGLTNPTLTSVFDVTGDVRYQFVGDPSEYGASFLTNFLDPRFNVNNAVLDGVGVMTSTDTFANLLTLGQGLDSRSLVVLGNQLVNATLYKGSALFELNYVTTAEFTAIRALRLTDGADISEYVVTSEGRDQTGGDGIAALPYANTPFRDLPIIDQDQEFSSLEISQLNNAGITVLGNNDSRNMIIVGRAVTTYKTNSAGVVDTTFHYLNAIDEAVTAREIFFNRSKQQFAQTRLTTGDLVANRSFVNEASLRAFFIQTFTDLSGQDFAITTAGSDALNYFKDNLDVEILDVQAGTAQANMRLPTVSQLRQINETISIVFNTNN